MSLTVDTKLHIRWSEIGIFISITTKITAFCEMKNDDPFLSIIHQRQLL